MESQRRAVSAWRCWMELRSPLSVVDLSLVGVRDLPGAVAAAMRRERALTLPMENPTDEQRFCPRVNRLVLIGQWKRRLGVRDVSEKIFDPA